MPHRAEQTRQRVRIARALGISRKTPGKVPRQVPPRLIERDYGRALAAYLEPLVRAAFAPLVAELPALLEVAARERRASLDHLDAGEGNRIRSLLDRARDSLRASVRGEDLAALARRFASQTSTHQRIQFNRQTRSALGVDVLGSNPALPALADAWVDANVGLVRGLGDRTASALESRVLAGVQDGKLWPDLAKDIERDLGFPRRRAELIARDQVGKLYGQVNAARQREAGITRFVWRTVRDERVRDEHDARDGQVYEYADPPDGELPGEPVLCRCSAEPVLEDLLVGI